MFLLVWFGMIAEDDNMAVLRGVFVNEEQGTATVTTNDTKKVPQNYTCKKCGMVYDKPLKRCAVCGAKMRQTIKVTKWDVLVIFIVLFVTGIVTGHTAKVIVTAENLLSSGFYASPIGKNIDDKAIEESLETMISKYNDNRLLWNETYLNHRVKFTEVADDIYGDANYGRIYIGSSVPTYADFKFFDTKELLSLRVGDSVTIIGTCDGFFKDGSRWYLKFSNCHIVNDG